ncbi:MAG: MoaD/ThiS family protein [Promethearchaeota archaeon]
MAGEIKIIFHANFREITKKKEVIEEIKEDYTIAYILEKLAKNYGKDFNNIIDRKTGKISSEALVLLNGRGIRATDIKLQDKDVLVISIPVGGGSK